MKNIEPLSILSQLPAILGKSHLYYYRRGNKFFFKAISNGEKFVLYTSPKNASILKEELVQNTVYC